MADQFDASRVLRCESSKVSGAGGDANREVGRERLTPAAIAMIAAVRPHVSLVRTAVRYPGLVNRLALAFGEPALLGSQLRKLTEAIQCERERFPQDVLRELSQFARALDAD